MSRTNHKLRKWKLHWWRKRGPETDCDRCRNRRSRWRKAEFAAEIRAARKDGYL